MRTYGLSSLSSWSASPGIRQRYELFEKVDMVTWHHHMVVGEWAAEELFHGAFELDANLSPAALLTVLAIDNRSSRRPYARQV